MRLFLFVAVMGLFLGNAKSALAHDSRAAKAERIGLWNKRAPTGDGTFQDAEAWLTIHRPEKPNGTAIVICPGGGYGGLVVGAEGHGIAAWLTRHGITAAVLEYRLPAGRSRIPLLDAQRAMRTVRANAKSWNLEHYLPPTGETCQLETALA
jgi:acetyl esterase/lipase